MYITTANELGNIMITSNVAAEVAGSVATQCYGVVGMASRSKKDGLVSLLKAENMARGINVTDAGDGVVIDLHVIMEYGVNIAAICKSIVNRVRYSLEEQTGIPVKQVNVRVEGIRVDD